MGEAKHTPGPWEVKPDRSNADRGWVEIHAGNRPVVDAASFDRHRGGETETHCGVRISPENARLISAAPELLAFAECWDAFEKEADEDIDGDEMLAVFKAHGWRGEVPAEVFMRSLRRAAIAKATGD